LQVISRLFLINSANQDILELSLKTISIIAKFFRNL
jgi:hypothetical protein